MGIVQEWRPGEALWVPLGLGGAGLALRTPPKPKEGTGGHRVRGGGDPVLPGWPCRGLAWGRRKGSVWERGRSEEGEGTLRAPPAPFPAHPRACRAPEHWRLCQVHPKNQPRVGSQPPASPGACPSPAAGRGARRRAWNGTEEPLGGAGAQVPSPGGAAPPVGAPWGSPSPALPVPAQRGEKFAANWFEGRRAGTCSARTSPGWERGMGAMGEPAATAVLLPAPGGARTPGWGSERPKGHLGRVGVPSSCCHPFYVLLSLPSLVILSFLLLPSLHRSAAPRDAPAPSCSPPELASCPAHPSPARSPRALSRGWTP